ncbi:MAG: hypothetical protein LBR93_07105 [Treponema sp.]|jgi:hypothetical protein|nr:hypothetical protein [Treponema sp.]
MIVLKRVLVTVLLLGLAGGAFAITKDEVKQNAQTTLQSVKQQATQNDSDLAGREVLSEGNTANSRFALLKRRLDVQAVTVSREKDHIDFVLASGHTAKPEDLLRYEKAIAEYAKRVKELEDWITNHD